VRGSRVLPKLLSVFDYFTLSDLHLVDEASALPSRIGLLVARALSAMRLEAFANPKDELRKSRPASCGLVRQVFAAFPHLND
jgi:hypothetical protein